MKRGVVSAASLAAAILSLATAALVLRLPGSVILIGVTSVAAIAITGVRWPHSGTWPLWVFLGSAIVCSSLSVVIAPAGVALVNFATLAAIFTSYAIAVLCGNSARTISQAVSKAFYYSLGFAMVLGWFEVITGFNFRAAFFPASSNSSDVYQRGRFLVSAWFVNYNDYAVVVTMFAVLVLVRILFDVRGPMVQVGRVVAFLSASAQIFLAGSRGALLALLIGAALACLQSIRVKRPRLIDGLAVVAGALGVAIVVSLLLGSAWVQDNSTRVRGAILANTVEMATDRGLRFWLGWGDSERFVQDASKYFPGQLMDPHNLLLELLVWFGAPTLLAFVVLWFVVLLRGVWRMETQADWVGVGAVLLFTLMPVLGVIPSSSMRYYYVLITAVCAMAVLVPGGQWDERVSASDIPHSLPPRPNVGQGVHVPPCENV